MNDLVQSAMESSEVRARLQGERRQRPGDAQGRKSSLKAQVEKAHDLRTMAVKSTSSPFIEFVIAAAVADEVADSNEEQKKQRFADEIAERLRRSIQSSSGSRRREQEQLRRDAHHWPGRAPLKDGY